MNVAIAGIPGSGKTTLARALEARGYGYIGTGDTARAVDSAAVAAGGLADEALFRRAFLMRVAKWTGPRPIVFDGIPRSHEQVELLPNGTRIVVLCCKPSTAAVRLLARGRLDDTPEIIDRRLREQTELLEVAYSTGWLYRLAGMRAVFWTDDKTPEEISAAVVDYLGV